MRGTGGPPGNTCRLQRRRTGHAGERQIANGRISVRVQPASAECVPAVCLLLPQIQRVGAGLLRSPAGARSPAPSRPACGRGQVGQDHLRGVESSGRVRREPPFGDDDTATFAAGGVRGFGTNYCSEVLTSVIGSLGIRTRVGGEALSAPNLFAVRPHRPSRWICHRRKDEWVETKTLLEGLCDLSEWCFMLQKDRCFQELESTWKSGLFELQITGEGL